MKDLFTRGGIIHEREKTDQMKVVMCHNLAINKTILGVFLMEHEIYWASQM